MVNAFRLDGVGVHTTSERPALLRGLTPASTKTALRSTAAKGKRACVLHNVEAERRDHPGIGWSMLIRKVLKKAWQAVQFVVLFHRV
jgi:hypothetical protein